MCKKCFCSIVPPNVLSGLSKSGSEASKLALADLASLKQKREATLASLTKKEITKGNANRYVYDSQNSWELRKKLVRQENGNQDQDNDVNIVYDISGFMKNYLMDTFNYDSLDDNGMDLIFNVHYRTDYNNAFWDGDEMAFGDGDGKNFIGFVGSIDVIAHELMHGITQFTANLQYYGQSGALNEHFSDVFGTIIKQRLLKQTPTEGDWLIGNDIIGPDFPGQALRSMKDPGTANDYDDQPDHMDNYYSGNEDNQGVHANSGIPNKAFYLATMQLGLEVTEQVWFQTLKKLWATANFNDMLEKVLEVTSEMIHNNQIPENSLTIIEEAFSNVGLKADKLSLNYQIEISGGILPVNEILKGKIEDHELIKYIEQNKITDLNNNSMRDGQAYKFNLKTNKLKRQFTVDESNLNDHLKKIIDIAQKSKALK
ncbi:thermolysin metallopeptidase-like protein [Chryseobacterium sp. 52]|uniref:M4 family metallopeptidase n=1 Tax=Chryseobacterium sp. 52 TaxID=2035213 RepID=UPI000C179741|nr:M4 family metallopeptidase [Chryseobacterium sp. 52]PIF47491.1 thermolysin metallopeptidase-like protein [Chryseobacterium sp. 52]